MKKADITFSLEQIVLLREFYCSSLPSYKFAEKKELPVVHLCAGFVSLRSQILKWPSL